MNRSERYLHDIEQYAIRRNALIFAGFILMFFILLVINHNISQLTPNLSQDVLVEGQVQRMSDYRVVVGGKFYKFCSSDLALIEVGDTVKIFKEEEFFSCGDIQLIGVYRE